MINHMTILLLKLGSLFKTLQILLVSGIKFFLAPPISNVYGFGYFETIITTTAGGIIGVLFFYYLSGMLIRLVRRLTPRIQPYFNPIREEIFSLFQYQPSQPIEIKKKKIFTKKNRFIIFTRKRFGLIGIAILTPVLLSIPLGTFLTAKYYPRQKYKLLYLTISVVFWSFFISSVVFFKGFNPIK